MPNISGRLPLEGREGIKGERNEKARVGLLQETRRRMYQSNRFNLLPRARKCDLRAKATGVAVGYGASSSASPRFVPTAGGAMSVREVLMGPGAVVLLIAVEIRVSFAEPPTAMGTVGALLWVMYHPNPIPAPMASKRKMEMHHMNLDMLLLLPNADRSHWLFLRFGSSLAMKLNLRQNSSPFGVFLGNNVSSEFPRRIEPSFTANSTFLSDTDP